MMNNLISVIVPVYNVENYLNKCIESILSQTYSCFELVLVDDGSTDNSGIICNSYKEKDNRVLVYHKKNGGLSDARNYGLDKANGDLVTFVDSDDYVESDYLECLYSAMIENNADISIVAYKRFDEKGRISYDLDLGSSMILNKKEALLNLFYQKNISVSACGKLYKKGLFEHNKFDFGKLYEDVLAVPRLISKAKIITYTNKSLVNYRIRSNSITESSFSKSTIDMLINSIEISNMFQNDPEISKACHAYIFSKASKLYYLITKQTSSKEYLEEKNYIWEQIKKYRHSNIFDKNARFNNKVGGFLSLFGKKVFLLAFSIKEIKH